MEFFGTLRFGGVVAAHRVAGNIEVESENWFAGSVVIPPTCQLHAGVYALETGDGRIGDVIFTGAAPHRHGWQVVPFQGVSRLAVPGGTSRTG